MVTAGSCEETASIEFMLLNNCFPSPMPCPASQMCRSGSVFVANLNNENAYITRKMTVMARGDDGRSMLAMMKLLDDVII